MYFIRPLKWAGASVSYSIYAPVEKKTSHWRYFVMAFVVALLLVGANFASDIYVQSAAKINLASSTAANSPVKSEQTQSPLNDQHGATPVSKKNNDSSIKVQAVLNAWATSHSSQQWSVVVQGFGYDKTMANINPDATYDPASVYKLYFTYPLLQQYSFDYLTKHFVTVAGKSNVTMKDCMELMIENSDNPCGMAIGNRIGWGRTTKILQSLGLQNTNLNSLNGMTTTAADANLFLQKLGSNNLLAADAKPYLMNLMQQQKYRDGIPAGCPNCTVADKTGDLGTVRHDVGIVQYPGGSYTLVIMTNGAPYSQIAELSRQIQSAINN